MRLLLIVNTMASAVTPRARVVIQKALSADHEVQVAETFRRGHAARLAQGAAARGVEVVVVLGGDGTLNEAANGLAGSRTALGVLPGGSTNVFARTVGYTNDPIEATGELLVALARTGTIRRVGLGSVNDRYFLFHLGVGMDAAVVARVERHHGLKRWAGHPLFVYAGFATWFRLERRDPAIVVHFDDGSSETAYQVMCLNADPYTFLGARPMRLAPDTSLKRPLAVVAFRSINFVPLMRIVGSSLGLGRPVPSYRRVDVRYDVAAVTLRAEHGAAYQVDGDHLGTAHELVVRYEPDVLDLVFATSE